jgi:hypothetical protein
LVDDMTLGRVIAVAGERRSWWPPERTWVRTYGRFDPGRAAFATLLFESREEPQEICQIEAFEACSPEQNAAQVCVIDSVAGYLRLTRFPSDPTMPMLPVILSRSGHPTVVRYRPQKRCTIRFEHMHDGRSGFAKVFADDRGSRIHRDSLALWDAACKGALGFAVARPLRWEPLTRTVWQGRVEGIPVKTRLFGEDGPALAEHMGRAVASLTRCGLVPDMTFDGRMQLQRSLHYGEELGWRVPSLVATVDRLLKNVSDIHTAMEGRSLVPIHSAPHVHQWLVEGSCLGLVDFDRFALGDPELDVSTFLSEMDFEDSSHIPVEQINRSFLTGYESIAGPLDPKLLTAYRAHKRLAKALKAARAVRPDGDNRAARNLQRALACVSEDIV